MLSLTEYILKISLCCPSPLYSVLAWLLSRAQVIMMTPLLPILILLLASTTMSQIPDGCYNCGLPDHPNCGFSDCTTTCGWCKMAPRDLGQDIQDMNNVGMVWIWMDWRFILLEQMYHLYVKRVLKYTSLSSSLSK